MANSNHISDCLKNDCQRAVDRRIATHGWQLLDRVEFVRRVVAYVSADRPVDSRHAALYTYSAVLYHACSGTEGADRQARGYTELYNYLYDVAARRYPTYCAEVSQDAIEAIYMAFSRCREPGAFLAFALHHLLEAGTAHTGKAPHSCVAPATA